MKLDRPSEIRLSLRQQIHRAWHRIRGGELTPSRAAWSVALGLFVGVQPTPGIHLPVVLGSCLLLRLDGAVAYLAANISIPPIAPFLWFTAFQIGAKLTTGAFLPMTVQGARELVRDHTLALAGSLFLGSAVLGLVLAVVGGLLTFVIASRRERARLLSGEGSVGNTFEAALARTAERYARAAQSRGTYFYVKGKLSGDPSTRAVAQSAPLGDVIDLGCGRGQLAVLLLEARAATSVRGFDWDEAKVDVARRAGDGLAGTFARGDVRAVETEPADTVLLIDVLHYFDRATQDGILLRAADLVRPGGRLLLRDADLGQGWRSTATKIPEAIGTAIRFNRGERVLFRDIARELVPALEARGFACEVRPCWGGTPFANVLLVAKRR